LSFGRFQPLEKQRVLRVFVPNIKDTVLQDMIIYSLIPIYIKAGVILLPETPTLKILTTRYKTVRRHDTQGSENYRIFGLRFQIEMVVSGSKIRFERIRSHYKRHCLAENDSL
jgi:hypothetical protein